MEVAALPIEKYEDEQVSDLEESMRTTQIQLRRSSDSYSVF
jgi:hypothetical protein